MTPNQAIILNFVKARKGEQGSNVKYYKREPKAKGGYRYWYTKEEYDKDHKKVEPKKDETKAPSIWSKVASFFHVSPTEVKSKIESEYNSNITEITKEAGPVTKQDFASHLAEYFSNKAKWDSKFKAKKEDKPAKEKKLKEEVGDDTDVVTKDEKEKTPKEKVASQAEKFQDGKKWNLKLMGFIAGKYSDSPKSQPETKPIADSKLLTKEDAIIANWEKDIDSKGIDALLSDRLGSTDPQKVADKLGIFKEADIDENIEYNKNAIEDAKQNENLRNNDPYSYGRVLQNHIVELKALEWLKENSPFDGSENLSPTEKEIRSFEAADNLSTGALAVLDRMKASLPGKLSKIPEIKRVHGINGDMFIVDGFPKTFKTEQEARDFLTESLDPDARSKAMEGNENAKKDGIIEKDNTFTNPKTGKVTQFGWAYPTSSIGNTLGVNYATDYYAEGKINKKGVFIADVYYEANSKEEAREKANAIVSGNNEGLSIPRYPDARAKAIAGASTAIDKLKKKTLT